MIERQRSPRGTLVSHPYDRYCVGHLDESFAASIFDDSLAGVIDSLIPLPLAVVGATIPYYMVACLPSPDDYAIGYPSSSFVCRIDPASHSVSHSFDDSRYAAPWR